MARSSQRAQKEGETDDEAQAGHDRAKDLFEKARQAVWDSKDPHEQMTKKSLKSDRLHRKVVSMEKEVAEHMEEKLAAEQKAEECQSKIDKTLDEIDETKAEIQKLLEESHTIREKMVGSNPEGLGELGDKQCAITLGMFDDPLVSTDECARAKRPEVVQLTNTVGEALRALALITSQIKGGLDEATKKAAAEAEKSAADTKEKEKTLATAKKAADVVKSKQGDSGPSSSAPAGAERSGKSALEAALAKPISQRNGEELRITGRAGKVRKTDAVAADLDLSNV